MVFLEMGWRRIFPEALQMRQLDGFVYMRTQKESRCLTDMPGAWTMGPDSSDVNLQMFDSRRPVC
ncbi:MAG TPA: hypothetical protein DHV36_18165 [Desulfobacteraceae bacterium]|nr:hypothetical protein [Desulfobacteraceae bacterium]